MKPSLKEEQEQSTNMHMQQQLAGCREVSSTITVPLEQLPMLARQAAAAAAAVADLLAAAAT
jgi:hypothetical protein